MEDVCAHVPLLYVTLCKEICAHPGPPWYLLVASFNPPSGKKASPFKNENLLIWFYFVTIVIWAGVVSTQMMHLTVQMKFTASNKINSIFLKCCWELGSVYLLFYFRNLESWQSKICWLPLRYCIYATIST